MSTFEHYAHYYDLLYSDKKYDAEAEFVSDLIRRQTSDAKNILELGSGTGLHALALGRRGYNVVGIDLSKNMVERAEKRLVDAQLPSGVSVAFDQEDMRTVRMKERFDAVISLFHVMSYQTTNDDILASIMTASEHLKQGGVFIFDCWYGPGVLTKRPTVRVKRMEDKVIRVTRIAEPTMHLNENVVEVSYEVLMEERVTRRIERVKEKHRMRYFFKPEISHFLSCAGLVLVEFGEWLTSRPAELDTWSAYAVATATERARA
jgi:predicted TPR repeat methyltransferase